MYLLCYGGSQRKPGGELDPCIWRVHGVNINSTTEYTLFKYCKHDPLERINSKTKRIQKVEDTTEIQM